MKLVVQQPGAREIKLKLLLAGGQSAALVLSPEHPLLAQLLGAIADRSSGASGNGALFQIPMEGGRASLTFAADQLVGVVTDPAVMIQPDGQSESGAAPAASHAATASAGISAAQGGDLRRYPVVQLDGFLSGSEVAWLMELTFAAESRFVRSRLTVDESRLAQSQLPDQRDDYRHSLMLSAPHEVSELMVAKIKAVMPQVMAQLRMRGFAVGHIDCQITASIDGSYFKAHTDAGLANETLKRELTYVFYFNREPKGFTGGELRIYDGRIRDGKLSAATDSYQVIEPRHNSIVFFRAALVHEVVRVTVPSKAFRDARFTVNGWVDRV